MLGRGQRFPRASRLLRRRDFQSVGRWGRRVVGRSFVMVTAPTADAESSCGARLGVTVSRRVGAAVVRNRLKRRVREWFRRSRGALPAGVDLVVIARRGSGALSGSQVVAGLDELLRRAQADRP